MVLLYIIAIGVLFFSLVIAITQVWIPAAQGRRIFPSFRSDGLSAKVEQTEEEVNQLQEQTDNLKKLSKLKAQKVALEKEISNIEDQQKEAK